MRTTRLTQISTRRKRSSAWAFRREDRFVAFGMILKLTDQRFSVRPVAELLVEQVVNRFRQKVH